MKDAPGRIVDDPTPLSVYGVYYCVCVRTSVVCTSLTGGVLMWCNPK